MEFRRVLFRSVFGIDWPVRLGCSLAAARSTRCRDHGGQPAFGAALCPSYDAAQQDRSSRCSVARRICPAHAFPALAAAFPGRPSTLCLSARHSSNHGEPYHAEKPTACRQRYRDHSPDCASGTGTQSGTAATLHAAAHPGSFAAHRFRPAVTAALPPAAEFSRDCSDQCPAVAWRTRSASPRLYRSPVGSLRRPGSTAIYFRQVGGKESSHQQGGQSTSAPRSVHARSGGGPSPSWLPRLLPTTAGPGQTQDGRSGSGYAQTTARHLWSLSLSSTLRCRQALPITIPHTI